MEGGKNMENTQKQSTKCAACGGKIDIDTSSDISVCPFCGTEYSTEILLGLGDEVRAEKIKTEAYKEIEKEKLKYEAAKEEKQEDKDNLNKFKKGKSSKLLIVFIIICLIACFTCFAAGKVLAGFIALLQVGLGIFAWLTGMQIIKTKIKNLHSFAAVLSLILIVPFMFATAQKPSQYQPIKWSELYLADKLPEPESNQGQVHSDRDDYLSVEIANTTLKQYKDYVRKCQDKGFTVDAENSDSTYQAYNKDGYKLYVYHSESFNEMNINLDAPEKMEAITWPTYGIAQKLPTPKSTQGKISSNNANSFSVNISNMTKADYENYISQCMEKGFSVDYKKDANYYSALNTDGDKVTIEYRGNNIVSVSIKAPEESAAMPETTQTATEKPTEKPAEKPVAASEQKSTQQSGSGVSPDFKAAMDSYEAFFDEYVAFMKKYKNSTDTTSLLKDYSNYMTKYSDTMQKMSSIDTNSLSKEDYAYYIDVQARITKKLADVY